MLEQIAVDTDLTPSTRHCAREGCGGWQTTVAKYCSTLCSEIDSKLETTRAFIAEKGISPATAALWAAAVSLSDQLSELDRLAKRLMHPEAAG